MKYPVFVTILIATIASNNSCMEIQTREPFDLLLGQLYCIKAYGVKNYKEYHELRDILANNIVADYTTIDHAQQYKMLKACIDFCNDGWLKICLDCGFNPNRYHKNISLLHRAVHERNSQALWLLADANADLVPRHNFGATFYGKPISETPLDYAIRLSKAPHRDHNITLQFCECANVMKQAIKIRYNGIICNKKHCGLTKHLIGTERPCTLCIQELSEQLQWHGISYLPYSATSDYSSTAPEADSTSCPESGNI